MVGIWVYIVLVLTGQGYCQEYNYYGQGWTEMPPNIPKDAVLIELINNLIETFPDDAFEGFYQLQTLYLGKNPLKEFPNLIPVSNTVRKAFMPECHITEVNETIINELKVLQHLRFQGCTLSSLPNVPGPGNSLLSIWAYGCQLTKFPAVNHYRVLETLNIGNNPMTSVQDSDVDNLEKLKTLKLNNVPLHTLPYNPKALQTVTTLDITSSGVTTVPLTCPKQNLALNGLGSQVSLCTCENVWLKTVDGQRGSVQLDDMTRGDATTTDEILQQACQRPAVAIREIISETKHEGFLCQFPIHSYVTAVSRLHCTWLCIDTLGCSSFSFRFTDGRLGNCAIIAPTDSALTDIPDADSPGWNYRIVKEV